MADRVLAAKQGLDTDALSPRDVNVRIPNRPLIDAAKVKATLAAKTNQKDKDHPPPPPSIIYEPPSFDRQDGAAYQVGKMLGKGGFAVCYEGTLQGTRRRYALKIVKSKMPPKMEQKVSLAVGRYCRLSLTRIAVPNRASNPLQDEASESRPISAGLFHGQVHIPRFGTVPERFFDGHGQAP